MFSSTFNTFQVFTHPKNGHSKRKKSTAMLLLRQNISGCGGGSWSIAEYGWITWKRRSGLEGLGF